MSNSFATGQLHDSIEEQQRLQTYDRVPGY